MKYDKETKKPKPDKTIHKIVSVSNENICYEHIFDKEDNFELELKSYMLLLHQKNFKEIRVVKEEIYQIDTNDEED